MNAETISISKQEYDSMKQELVTLRKTGIYLRLLEFEQNIAKSRSYTRKDLGF